MFTKPKTNNKEERVMVKDIVCGMMINEHKPPAKSSYEGKEYYFCSDNCKSKFESNPREYIKEPEKGKDEK